MSGMNGSDVELSTESIISMIPMLDRNHVSPVTLSTEWSRVAKLLIMASLSVIGSIGNVYMISSVMVDEHLNKRGNAFIANVALADVLISGIAIPASAVIVLAGSDDSNIVCHLQFFLAYLCCLVTILTLLMNAIENYCRLCLSPEFYNKFTSTSITIILLLIWIISLLLVSIKFIFKYGPDYCDIIFEKIQFSQLIIISTLIFIPLFITGFIYFKTIFKIKKAKSNPSFKPPVAFNWEYSLMLTNFYSFIMFIIFWSPFGFILTLSSVKPVSAFIFFQLEWFALSKSCFNNILYCICDRNFRNAYINLFRYCCCKTTVSFSRRPRAESSRPSGDVRVHIIPGYNVYHYTSPQRAGESSKKTAGKRTAFSTTRTTSKTRSSGKDVYQL